MSIINELGTGYANDFFIGAMFVKGNNLYQFARARSSSLEVFHIDLNQPPRDWSLTSIPVDAINSFADIAWPRLGYRNLLTHNGNNFFAWVSAARTVHRGLRLENLSWQVPTAAEAINLNLGSTRVYNGYTKAYEIFKPTFYGYREGIKNMMEGKWLGFAINEDVAIVLSVSGDASAFADILYRNKVVGYVTKDGIIEVNNKILRRSALRSLFNT